METKEEISIVECKPQEQEFAIMWRNGMRGVVVTKSEIIDIHKKLGEFIDNDFKTAESEEEFIKKE